MVALVLLSITVSEKYGSAEIVYPEHVIAMEETDFCRLPRA